MKFTRITFSIVFFSFGVFLISCGGPSKKSYLVHASWRFSDISSPSSDSAVYSALINNRVFLTDQVLKFNEDNSFASYFPNPQMNTTGNWEMNSDETKITLFSNGDKSTWDVQILDETTFEMRRHDVTLDADLIYRYVLK